MKIQEYFRYFNFHKIYNNLEKVKLLMEIKNSLKLLNFEKCKNNLKFLNDN